MTGKRRVSTVLAAAVVAATLSSGACYEAKPLRLHVQSPITALDCARVADQVFFSAAYERVSNVSGPDLFYSPRVSPTVRATGRADVGLGWGIGVWLNEKGRLDSAGHCGFDLESLSAEPPCALQCVYSPQRGASFDENLHEMAQRLTAAFGDAKSPD